MKTRKKEIVKFHVFLFLINNSIYLSSFLINFI